MKKLLFAFEDADFKVLDNYKRLGFKIEIDDAVNNIYYVEADLTNYDMLALQVMLDECELYNLHVGINLDGVMYDSKFDAAELNKIIDTDPLRI